MFLNATDLKSDECVSELHFMPEGSGLTVRFGLAGSGAEFDYLRSPPMREPGEQRRELRVGVELSRDHGIMTVPVRLPRYLMPEWSQSEWLKFIESQRGFFHSFVEEAVVQCLSLALVADSDRRKDILRTANEVVTDFRGDQRNR
jgi:hypothetical protein